MTEDVINEGMANNRDPELPISVSGEIGETSFSPELSNNELPVNKSAEEWLVLEIKNLGMEVLELRAMITKQDSKIARLTKKVANLTAISVSRPKIVKKPTISKSQY